MANRFLETKLRESLGLDADGASQIVQLAASSDPTAARLLLEDVLGGESGAINEYISLREKTESAKNSPRVPGSPRGKRTPLSAALSTVASAGASRNSSRSASRNASPGPARESGSSLGGEAFVSRGVWEAVPTKKQEKSQRAQRSGGQSSSASANKIKVNALADIEFALSKLELATQEGKKRVECNCMGTRHPLLEIAPNCLACGKINCSKEGFGPCLFCGQPLMTRDQVNEIMTILSQERDEIAQSLGKRARKQAGIKTDVASALDSANQRLDRLLQYQDTSAQRTKIIDQASDFETPSMGVNQWASPVEQARQLKQQQRRMRKMQEDHLARTGRGRKVISIDLKGNKVYQVEQASSQLSDSEEADEDEADMAATDPENRSSDAKMLRFWDPKAYGKKFVKPEYVSEGHKAGAVPEMAAAGSQQQSRVVDDEDDETRLLEM